MSGECDLQRNKDIESAMEEFIEMNALCRDRTEDFGHADLPEDISDFIEEANEKISSFGEFVATLPIWKIYYDLLFNLLIAAGLRQLDFVRWCQDDFKFCGYSAVSQFFRKKFDETTSRQIMDAMQQFFDQLGVERRTYHRYSLSELAILENSYAENDRPNSATVAQLAAQLKKKPNQVSTWF